VTKSRREERRRDLTAGEGGSQDSEDNGGREEKGREGAENFSSESESSVY
jgi:hypothetical protein